ncbi:MAG: hypothetical protein ACRDT4_21245 [Micromonosporaceae bacterium]
MRHLRRWGAVYALLLLGAKHWIFKADAEDLERIEAKIDKLQDRLDLPTPPPEQT